MSDEPKKRRKWVWWAVAPLLYLGAYILFVQGLSSVTFSEGPDSAPGEHQIVWERKLPPAGSVFAPLEVADRKLRPGFWDWEERVRDSDIKTWLRDKRMQ
ncbi:MAG TPA: hypothetical protein VGP76_04015 [Planctomycetaceae bacterium]|jgi:hypothetical protein|nr:hypothetical protein [Planctomycetaceae bacterium]